MNLEYQMDKIVRICVNKFNYSCNKQKYYDFYRIFDPAYLKLKELPSAGAQWTGG